MKEYLEEEEESLLKTEIIMLLLWMIDNSDNRVGAEELRGKSSHHIWVVVPVPASHLQLLELNLLKDSQLLMQE